MLKRKIWERGTGLRLKGMRWSTHLSNAPENRELFAPMRITRRHILNDWTPPKLRFRSDYFHFFIDRIKYISACLLYHISHIEIEAVLNIPCDTLTRFEGWLIWKWHWPFARPHLHTDELEINKIHNQIESGNLVLKAKVTRKCDRFLREESFFVNFPFPVECFFSSTPSVCICQRIEAVWIQRSHRMWLN